MDKGPWVVDDKMVKGVAGGSQRQITVGSDDFTHDVLIRFTGDFANNDERRKYADWLCDALNRASARATDSREGT